MRRLGITRSDDRWIGGVSGGIGDRFGIDPLLVRGIFVATLLLGGIGLVAYGAAWALLPERRDGRIHLEEMILGRFDIALLGALAFVIVGFGRGDNWFLPVGSPGWVQGLLWLAFVGGIVALIVTVANQQPSRPRPPAPPYTPYVPPAPAASYPRPATRPPATRPPATRLPATPPRYHHGAGHRHPAPSSAYGAPPAPAPAPAWTSYAPPQAAPAPRTAHQRPPRPPRPRTLVPASAPSAWSSH